MVEQVKTVHVLCPVYVNIIIIILCSRNDALQSNSLNTRNGL